MKFKISSLIILLLMIFMFQMEIFSAPKPQATIGSWQVRGMIRTNIIANYYLLPVNTNVNALDIYCVTGVSNGQSAGFYQNLHNSWKLLMPISFTNSNLSGNYLPITLTNSRILTSKYTNNGYFLRQSWSNTAKSYFIPISDTNYLFQYAYTNGIIRNTITSLGWTRVLNWSNILSTGNYDLNWNIGYATTGSNIQIAVYCGNTNNRMLESIVDYTTGTNQKRDWTDFMNKIALTNLQNIQVWAKIKAASGTVVVKEEKLKVHKNYK